MGQAIRAINLNVEPRVGLHLLHDLNTEGFKPLFKHTGRTSKFEGVSVMETSRLDKHFVNTLL